MKKVLSWILIAAMLLSCVAMAETIPSPGAGNVPSIDSGDVDKPGSGTVTPSPDAPSVDPSPDAPSIDPSPDAPSVDPSPDAPSVEPSPDAEDAGLVYVIDFEDENFAFLGISTGTGDADASVLSVEDYNGSKALRVDVKAKNPYVVLNVDGLLGENLAKVASITFDIGVELGSDGKFYAASGKVITVTGADQAKTNYDWSVYLKSKNPKTATVTLKDVFFTNGQGELLMICKDKDAFVDSKKFAGQEPRDLYIDNIMFLDAEGNPLPLNLSAVYEAAGDEADLSNLSVLTGAVELPGMAVEGGAWSQNGVEMSPEFLAALVPGSVVEISYESEDGDIWVVMPWASAGWIRVAQGTATKNNSKNTAQIPYEKFVELLGEDTSTWGAMFQCEGSSAWKVYSVKVGTPSPKISLSGAVEFPGFACEGGAWSQNGFEMPQEIIDALVPGTAVEIDFESENGDIWLVMPWAAAGWMRVGQGYATIVGSKAYVTYEQIAELCGEDKSTWGAMMQCEASGAWKVYSVKVGKVNQIYGVYDVVEFPGYAVEGGAWSQNGIEMPAEIVAALKPGAVVTINYESENGDIWLVMPWATAGWIRVQQQTADCDGQVAQITFEEIAAACGSEDVSTWGAMMQCEASGAWKVYSLSVGQAQ